MRFRAVPEGYDPTDRQAVARFVEDHRARGEVVTGLLYADATVSDLHDLNKTPSAALASVTYDRLCPGSEALAKLQAGFR
jgi:2-oxoglutarate ferredoxin oxidoreductase subunit beta